MIRKPGAALFAEMVAAGVSALLGSPWGADTLLSGFVQGAAAELVFAFTLYRVWSFPVLGVAAVASAAAAWIHDWALYYPDGRSAVQIVRGVAMAVSAIVFVARGSVAPSSARCGGRRARRVPGLTADRARVRVRRPRGSPMPGPTRPALRASRSTSTPGPSLLVVGPSGSGKSTLALAIAGLIPREFPASGGLTRGRRTDDAATLRSRSARRRAVGLVFQDPATPARHGAGRGRRRVRPREPRLAAGRDARPGAGGARRGRAGRAGAAPVAAGCRAASSSGSRSPASSRRAPGVLVLDEPTANLDPDGAAASSARSRAPRGGRRRRIVLIEHRVDRRLAAGRRRPRARRATAGPIDVGSPPRCPRAVRRADARRPGSGCPATRRTAGRRRMPAPSTREAPPGETAGPRRDGVRFGYRARTSPSCATSRCSRGRASGSRCRTERQRQVDARRGCSSGSCGRTTGRIELGGDDPARLPAATSRAARGTCSRSRSGSSSRRPWRRRSGSASTAEELARVDDADGTARPAARAIRRPQPVPPLGWRAAPAVAGLRARPAPRRCSSSTSRPSARTATATRPSSASSREHLDDGACLIAATHDQRFVGDVARRVVEIDVGLDRPRRAGRGGGRRVIAERLELGDSQLDSPLGRTSPVVKLGIAIAWLIGLAATLASAAAGRARGRRARRRAHDRWHPAARPRRAPSHRCGSPPSAIGLFNMLFSAANGDPTAVTLLQLGPIRVTEEAFVAGVALVLRVVAIACVGAVFALTTDSTRLADSLVQQARVPARFAYGALAAYQRDPAVRRGPRHAPAGATDPGSARPAGTRGCSSACSCSRSATATGWQSRWTRARSGPDRAPATARSAGRRWTWSWRLARSPRPSSSRSSWDGTIRANRQFAARPSDRGVSSDRRAHDRLLPRGCLRPHQQLRRDRAGPASARPPRRVHRRGVVRGHARGEGLRGAADAPRAAADGARGARASSGSTSSATRRRSSASRRSSSSASSSRRPGRRSSTARSTSTRGWPRSSTRSRRTSIVEDNVVAFPAIGASGRPWVRIVSCNPMEMKDPPIAPFCQGYPVADRSAWPAFLDEVRRTHGDMWADFDAFCRDHGDDWPDVRRARTGLHRRVAVPEPVLVSGRGRLRASNAARSDLAPTGLDRPGRRRRARSCRTTCAARDGALIYLSLGSLGSADVDLMQRLVDVLAHDRAPRHRLEGPAGRPDHAPRQPDRRGLPAPAGDPAEVDLVITHGGNNTVTEAFHHGKPMIVLPLFWDQVDNAQRVEETGFGRRLSTYGFDDVELTGAIDDAPGRPRLWRTVLPRCPHASSRRPARSVPPT